ncbi:platelet-derived growth factor receptor alpha isoform X2 [Penaeus vannamei]|uniref:platelet-derived growth factor receptor alpha isoform X2 n=1 Tax=Penaeus vannamei TaxID=6689 RepID=UPI00387FAAC3
MAKESLVLASSASSMKILLVLFILLVECHCTPIVHIYTAGHQDRYNQGETMKMACYTDHIDANFTWTFPGSASNVEREYGATHSILTLLNATIDDSGEYVCTAYMEGNVSISVSKNITIEESTTPYLIFSGQRYLTLSEGDTLYWQVDIRHYPTIFNYTIVNWRGEDLWNSSVFMSKYERSYGHVVMEADEVKAEHFGKYTLIGYLPEASIERNITLDLRVESQPRVSSVRRLVHTHRGKPETVDFHVTGYPVTNCTPGYFECNEGRGCTESESITMFNSSNVPPGNVVLVSVEFAPEESGKLRCTNKHSSASVDVIVKDLPASTSKPMWVALGITVVILAVVAACLVLQVRRVRRKKRELKQVKENLVLYFGKGRLSELDPNGAVADQAELLPYDPAWELDRKDIRLGKQLGVGSFGRVVLAYVRGLDQTTQGETEAAVKMVKSHVDVTHLESLMVELKILSHLGKHINIVNMLGANTVHLNKGELWILTEYCRHGNLLAFIRQHASKFIHQVDPQRDEIDLRILVNNPASLPRDHPGPLSRSVSIRTGSAIAATSLATDISIGPRAVTPTTLRKQRTAHANGTAQVHNPTYRSVPTADGADEPDERERCQDSAGQDYMKADSSAACTSGYQEGTPGISVPFNTSSLVCWAWQVAEGMSYLARRKILHGDLAARNLLLADENVVKISDFGLSRNMHGDIYQKKSSDLLPIKWMSVEAIRDCTFSVQSDIWAYGVTLWELFTLGSTPYPGVVVDVSFLDLIEGGYRMDKPKYATERIYKLILRTWSLHPSDRPSFGQISEEMSRMLHQDLQELYLSMNECYMKMNEAWFKERVDYLNLFRGPELEQPEAQEELGGGEAQEGMEEKGEKEESVGDEGEAEEVGEKEEGEAKKEEEDGGEGGGRGAGERAREGKEEEERRRREKGEENEDATARTHLSTSLEGSKSNDRDRKEAPNISPDYMRMV